MDFSVPQKCNLSLNLRPLVKSPFFRPEKSILSSRKATMGEVKSQSQLGVSVSVKLASGIAKLRVWN
jgi:hypothetical protein